MSEGQKGMGMTPRRGRQEKRKREGVREERTAHLFVHASWCAVESCIIGTMSQKVREKRKRMVWASTTCCHVPSRMVKSAKRTLASMSKRQQGRLKMSEWLWCGRGEETASGREKSDSKNRTKPDKKQTNSDRIHIIKHQATVKNRIPLVTILLLAISFMDGWPSI